MKKIIIGLAAVLVLAGGYAAYQALNQADEPEAATNNNLNEAEFDKSLYSLDQPGSLWWVVNKQRFIPGDYLPADLTSPDIKLRWAADAESMQVREVIRSDLEAMVRAARQAGHELMLVSAYRSFAYQKQLYDNYVKAYGEDEASRFSAKPGTSEHQTGLAIDLGRTDGKCEIEQCFGDTAEGRWLASNAAKYGFIVRYQKGREAVTGYQYEPWHFRYVGRELAAEIKQTGLTMEEYFGL
ncbi:MAG TPA: M15 family metallopeptidase [Candidatus Saccharimonadales bacterium]